MSSSITTMAIVAVCILILALDSNQELRNDLKTLQGDNDKLTRQIDWQNKTQIAVAAIDENRSRELSDAKNKIDDLQRDIDAGRKRLHLNATCEPTTAASLADGGRARLTDAAQRDYLTLRNRIEHARTQIAGLQDYIRTACQSQ